MTIAGEILNYASGRQSPFRRRDLMQALETNNVSEASAHVLLSRLVEQGRLVKQGHGLYALPLGGKKEFVYALSGEELHLTEQIKEKFPFADFCIWKPSILVPLMRHIPAMQMILVDVERTAMESVFHFLQGIVTDVPILLNPNKQECERYITTERIVIVRPLVNEAPLITVEATCVPTIEKILVDATGDKELNFAQGSELYTIYENTFETYNVNKNRLLRYASRRNRKEMIKKILDSLNL